MQACMLPQQVPAFAGHSSSPLLHPGPPPPAELNALTSWQQQTQQQPQQQQQQLLQEAAGFVPLAAGGISDRAGLLAVPGWQPLASAHSGQLEQQQEQQQMGLAASDDAGKKGRLRWTPQLHARFVAAVEQLGGAFTATPKRILSVMGVPGITLLQIKSHVQKYRNALGSPGGGKKRCGGGATRKRSAASLVSGGPGFSRGSSGACSDAEGEEDGPEAPPERSGGADDEGERSPKRASQAGPTLEAAAAAAGMPAAGPFGNSPAAAEPLLPGWGSEPDLEAIDGELAATLAPAGSLSGSEQLLDLQPEGLQELDEALSRELSCWAEGALPAPPGMPAAATAPAGAAAAVADEASDGTATRALSGAGSEGGPGRSNSGASHVNLWGGAAARPAAPAVAPVAVGRSSGGGATPSGSAPAPSSPALPAGLPADEAGLLQAALRIQVEMQRQLSSTIEAQRVLQQQMEAHGKYIEELLRSEGGLPPKPAPKEAGKARSGTGSARSGRASAHQRTRSMQREPSLPVPAPAAAHPIQRSNSAPAVADAAETQHAQQHAQQHAHQQAAAQAASLAQQHAEQAWQEQALPPQQAQQAQQMHQQHQQELQAQQQTQSQQTQAQQQQQQPALGRLPSWQLQQRFVQQQLELERHIQQRLAVLQAEAERQRRLLEQQQQQEATTAALCSADLDLLLMDDLPPGPALAGTGVAAEPTAAAAQLSQLPSLQTQGSRFSEASTGWVRDGSPDANALLRCPPPAASVAHAPSLSPGQPSSATHALPPLPAQPPGWAVPPANDASSCGALTGAVTVTATGHRDAEEPGQGYAASAPPPKRQQLPADRLQASVDVFDAAMWDSLLTDSGVLQQLMDP